MAGVRVHGDDRRVAPAREREGPGGVEGLEHLEALVGYDVGDRHASRRRTADGDGAVFDDEVLRVSLEHLGAAIEQLPPHRRGRARGGVADLDGAPAARGEQREWDVGGVARGDLDLLEGPAEPVGRDHGRHGFVALAAGCRADVEVRDPVLLEPHLRRLAATERCRLHATGEAEADELSVRGGLLAYLLDGEVEEPRVVAAVVDVSGATREEAGGVRDLLRRDEVSATQLDAIDFQLVASASIALSIA